ncbi:hypothetical protein ACRS5S_07825 [Nocardia asiatica]|uniref:hypothetical protein n=1 Tax=Nocardia asiatica TaxID=209252 RepID=UPI003EE3D680
MVHREGKIAMDFAPDPQHRYSDLEGMRRDEQHFRTLSIAGRPAFLIDEHNPRGSRNCRIRVSVPSGGAIRFLARDALIRPACPSHEGASFSSGACRLSGTPATARAAKHALWERRPGCVLSCAPASVLVPIPTNQGATMTDPKEFQSPATRRTDASPQPAVSSCCSAERQITCCDDSDKVTCCAPAATAGGGCGCQ